MAQEFLYRQTLGSDPLLVGLQRMKGDSVGQGTKGAWKHFS
jgi:hypothetical protein